MVYLVAAASAIIGLVVTVYGGFLGACSVVHVEALEDICGLFPVEQDQWFAGALMLLTSLLLGGGFITFGLMMMVPDFLRNSDAE